MESLLSHLDRDGDNKYRDNSKRVIAMLNFRGLTAIGTFLFLGLLYRAYDK